jgi:hypothetical protein
VRLSITFLGLDLFSVEVSTDSSSPEPDDCSRDLSGGTLTDCYLGFTNGREVE